MLVLRVCASVFVAWMAFVCERKSYRAWGGSQFKFNVMLVASRESTVSGVSIRFRFTFLGLVSRIFISLARDLFATDWKTRTEEEEEKNPISIASELCLSALIALSTILTTTTTRRSSMLLWMVDVSQRCDNIILLFAFIWANWIHFHALCPFAASPDFNFSYSLVSYFFLLLSPLLSLSFYVSRKLHNVHSISHCRNPQINS